jgi:hypothetical protein
MICFRLVSSIALLAAAAYAQCANDEMAMKLRMQTFKRDQNTFIEVVKMSKRLNRPVGKLMTWTETDSKKKVYTLPEGEDEYLCLQKDRCFKFVFSDAPSEAEMEFNEHGYVSAFIEDDVVFQAYSYIGYELDLIYCTPGPNNKYPYNIVCQDSAIYDYRGLSCREYIKMNGGVGKAKAKERCKTIYRGIGTYNWCPKSCGKAGIGSCDFLNGRKPRMKKRKGRKKKIGTVKSKTLRRTTPAM